MFKTLWSAIKTADIRKKLLYVLILIVVFRLGCFITVPAVDTIELNEQMSSQANGVTGVIDILSGGAFSRFSIFAMSIGPYITASIVIQLLGFIIPSLEKMMKEGGEDGKAKVNKYTKLLSIALSLVEGIGIYAAYQHSGIFINPGFFTGLLVVMSFVAGTAFLMWLGEQITRQGLGNGISMLIFIGILSGLPGFISTAYGLVLDNGFSATGLITVIALIIGAIILIAAVIFVTQSERRIPVQYSKKVVGRKMYGGQSTHIPLKLAMAGVMPIIFASAFMTFPAMFIQIFNPHIAEQTGFWAGVYKFSMATSTSQGVPLSYTLINALVYLLLIVGFTFFYTFATFNPAEVSSNIKKNGGFIPGIRAGKPTTDYLSSIMKKLTAFGSVFLALIAILPMLLRFTDFNITFGGTTILIVVGVAMEMILQLESQLVMRHYKGFLD